MNAVRLKLSVMMFLQFFIWGAWFPLIFGYLPSLGFTEFQQGWILGAFNLAAFAAMFFSTQFADRHFAAQRFVAFSHLVGGLAILGLFWIRKPSAEEPAAFWPFFLLILLHSLFYVPTISITNSIAFANLKEPQKEFGPVRLWGTIGWIAAAWPFVFILVNWEAVPTLAQLMEAKRALLQETGQALGVMDRVSVAFEWLGTALGTGKKDAAFREASSYTFVAAGGASLLLAAFSLLLPHTPPKPVGQATERFAWLEAMKLLRVPFVLVLFIVTFFDAAVHQSFFFWTERYLTGGVGIPSNWVMPVMSISQIAEIFTMALLGLVLKSLGWRFTMVIGILGHAARFGVFAFLPYPVPAVTINVLHGICYAFFFATVYIFVDEFFPKDARSSAQGLFNFLILGLGPFVANFVCARLGAIFQVSKDQFDFQAIFLVPCGVALVAAVFLLVFFHPPAKAAAELSPHLRDALEKDARPADKEKTDAIIDAQRRHGIAE